jgi:hypothetical protein
MLLRPVIAAAAAAQEARHHLQYKKLAKHTILVIRLTYSTWRPGSAAALKARRHLHKTSSSLLRCVARGAHTKDMPVLRSHEHGKLIIRRLVH